MAGRLLPSKRPARSPHVYRGPKGRWLGLERSAQASVGGQLAGLGLGDPLADDCGVCSGVERRPVLGQLLAAPADLFPEADQFARYGFVLGWPQGLRSWRAGPSLPRPRRGASDESVPSAQTDARRQR